MRKINAIFVWMVLVTGLIFLGANLYLENLLQSDGSRTYRVEVSRIEQKIKAGTPQTEWLSGCISVNNIVICTDKNEPAFWEGTNSDYLIREIDGQYYRFDYRSKNNSERGIRLAVNLGIGMMALTMMLFFIYIRKHMLKPFQRIQNVPYELSKGNLNVPLKENKNRYFGKFVWGLDMLRENLEDQKMREYELQKEKKTLILSISHDIKTPLSAIKLYARALSGNLYNDIEKQRQIAENIGKKADEIEDFVSQIIQASSEEFLNLEVKAGEFYLSQLMTEIVTYYAEKLGLLKIEFRSEKYTDCIIKGDLDRAVEVLQNIIENAVKYGDGRLIGISIIIEEDCRLITVENSGCTLPQSELPHIFESFWRGSNVGGNSGSGLGLYICRQLMYRMDGDIFAVCEDESMKVTAVFRVA